MKRMPDSELITADGDDSPCPWDCDGDYDMLDLNGMDCEETEMDGGEFEGA